MNSSKSTTASQALETLIRRSTELDECVIQLAADAPEPRARRQLLTVGLYQTALQHGLAKRLLIEADLPSSALALVRVQFEVTLRAAWTLMAAEDAWIDGILEGNPKDGMSEPKPWREIDKMLSDLESKAPDLVHAYRGLKPTIRAMNSFVHGGTHAAIAGLGAYTPDKLAAVLLNRNLMLLMLCNVMVVCSNDPKWMGIVGRLGKEFADALPPGRPAPIHHNSAGSQPN